eukprot:scaffold33699_cov24-Tisochrysis_lutea.AAC.3
MRRTSSRAVRRSGEREEETHLLGLLELRVELAVLLVGKVREVNKLLGISELSEVSHRVSGES